MPDEASFAEFYRATHRGVVAQLYAYTSDLAEAQESAQEAYVRAWMRWQKIAEYDEPRAWVCRVAYRVAISRWRRARTAADIWRRQGPPPPEPAPDGANADLVAALRRLPEPQRRALVLHYLGGFTVAEIAALDGVATGTVKSRLSRGRDALAALLGGYGSVSGLPSSPWRCAAVHDLDENLDRAIGARFGALHGSVIAAVSLPGAEEIIARGRRRRRNGHAAVGGLAVLAVLVVGSVLFGPLRVGGAPMPVDDPTMSWYEPPAGAVRPQPGSTIPMGFLPVAQVTEARLEPMCAGPASLVSNGAIAASAAGDGVALLVYGHSSTTIRALAEYRVETTRCVAPGAITDLKFGAGGFLVVRAAGDYQAVVRFGRALLLVRAATDLAVRRAGDLERTLCVFAYDCPAREGRPSALSTLEVGGEAFAAVLAVDAQPDAPVLGRAVASASVMGYRTSAASVDCDEGARQRLGLPAGVSHRYVAIYFGALEDAESFASSSTMSVRVVPVRTYCIG